MNHRETAIRAHTSAVLRAADRYRRENHCRCGAWLPFTTRYLETRYCDRCKLEAGAAS